MHWQNQEIGKEMTFPNVVLRLTAKAILLVQRLYVTA